MACEASKPTHKPHEAPSAFTVGSKSQSSESAGSQVEQNSKLTFQKRILKLSFQSRNLNLGMWIQKKNKTPSFAFQGGSNTEFKSNKD